MRDYVTLVGADEVKSAGRLMSNAADTMSQAALNMDGTCMRLGQQLDAATEAMNRLAAALEKSMPAPSTQRKVVPCISRPDGTACIDPAQCDATGCGRLQPAQD